MEAIVLYNVIWDETRRIHKSCDSRIFVLIEIFVGNKISVENRIFASKWLFEANRILTENDIFLVTKTFV